MGRSKVVEQLATYLKIPPVLLYLLGPSSHTFARPRWGTQTSRIDDL